MRKTGPKRDLYRKRLGQQIHAETPPRPNGKWRKLSALANSRLRGQRVLWFRKNHPEKFQAVADRVKSLRSKLKMTQKEFGEAAGVSAITIRRWELALGYTPLPEHLKRLEKLERNHVPSQ